MEQPKTRWQKFLDYLKPALAYRAKPGCPTCLSPILDENGKPVLPQDRPKPDSK